MLRSIEHSSHPRHNLEYIDTGYSLYGCDGCKQLGLGKRYKCEPCKFDLHKECATAPSYFYHPFHNAHQLKFHSEPPAGSVNPLLCSACGNSAYGFAYHCSSSSCGYVLHPYCANLPASETIEDDDSNGHKLLLSKCLTSPCDLCGEKGSGWGYATTSAGYNVHVSCVHKLIFFKASQRQSQVQASNSGMAVQQQSQVQASNSGMAIQHQAQVQASNSRMVQSSQRAARNGSRSVSLIWKLTKVAIDVATGDPTSLIGSAVDLFTDN